MHVLVTGGAGFIGRHLVDVLRRRGDDVWAVDDMSSSPWSDTPQRLDERDVRSLQPRELIEVDAIVHLAARKSVPESFQNRRNLLDNIDVDRHVLELVRAQPVRRALLATSCEVYGDVAELLVEDRQPRPRSPYAVGKAATELLADVYSSLTPTQICCLRLFNTYGPGEGADAVVPRFARDALATGTVSIEGDGSQRRFFSHVDEVVEILVRLLDATVLPRVLNVAAGQDASVLDLAHLVAAEVGAVDVVHTASRPNEIQRFIPDLTRLHACVGEVPGRSLRVGVRECLAWEARELARVGA